MHDQNANCHNSVTPQLIIIKSMFFVMLNPFQDSKRAQKTKSPPISTKNHAQFFINWYEILKSALSLLKQTVLINMYVFVTSKHVKSDNLCIYGYPEDIFKMLAMENNKKPNFGLSIIQLLFVTNLQYLPINIYFWES